MLSCICFWVAGCPANTRLIKDAPMSLATVTAFPSAPPSPPSAATPTGEPPVYLHGTIAQAMPDEIVVLVEGSAYNVRLTPSTLVLSATPRHPYPTGADVILAGHFDEVSRTGVAYQIWVNFIHVRGLIVQVFPDAEGITLTVQDLETRRPTQVRLAHEPVIPALIGMEGERVASLDVLECVKNGIECPQIAGLRCPLIIG